MAYDYLFFKPKYLPLTAEELGEHCVERLTDVASVRAAVLSVFPQMIWPEGDWGRGEFADGRWFEFSVYRSATACMRCSLRSDYRAEVQLVCDRLGWVAIDETPRIYLPTIDK